MAFVRVWQRSADARLLQPVAPKAENALAHRVIVAYSRLIRLKKRSEFLSVAASGVRCGTHSLVVQVRQNSADNHNNETNTQPPIRVGFTATKRLGNAVLRNRAKRRMRAAAMEILPVHGRPGADYVLIARDLCVTCPYDALCRDLIYALKRVHTA